MHFFIIHIFSSSFIFSIVSLVLIPKYHLQLPPIMYFACFLLFIISLVMLIIVPKQFEKIELLKKYGTRNENQRRAERKNQHLNEEGEKEDTEDSSNEKAWTMGWSPFSQEGGAEAEKRQRAASLAPVDDCANRQFSS